MTCVLSNLSLRALTIVLGSLLAMRAAAAEETVTVDLKSFIELRDKIDRLEKAAAVVAPSGSVLQRALFTGRFAGQNLELTGVLNVVVAGGGHVERPLLQLDDGFTILEVEDLVGAMVKVEDRHLVFVTDQAGTYKVTVKVLVFGDHAAAKRVVLNLVRPTFAQASIAVDASMFDVTGPRLTTSPEGVVVLARNGVIEFSWRPKAAALALQATPKVARQKKVDPFVERAFTTFITTQDGRSVVQMRLDLSISEMREVAVDLGPDMVPESVLVNDMPTDYKMDATALRLKVQPKAVGSNDASVELLARKRDRPFLLSGQISVALPKVDLLTNTSELKLFLPKTFEYKVRGGSFTLLEGDALSAPRYAVTLPTPGKVFSFRQHLVADASPFVELSYTVDLQNQYFTGVPDRGVSR